MSISLWAPGERVVRREFLHGQPWIGFTTYVVKDAADLLAVYLPSGSELAFPDWPFDRWEHPWRTAGNRRWRGHGKLMLHRPGDAYSVDLFWRGESREFAGWYVNLQDPFRRHDRGFDTLDHELDYWVAPDGTWSEKDGELFEQRVAEGRYEAGTAEAVRRTGADVRAMLTLGTHWWDDSWRHWRPPAEWGATTLPQGWSEQPPAAVVRARLVPPVARPRDGAGR
ncbi:MAG: DUF402 domain-containing protein [Nocardioidaceae bacterium]